MLKRVLGIITLTVMLTTTLSGCGGASKTSSKVNSSDGKNTFEIATVRWSDWGEDYHKGFIDDSAKELGLSIKWDTILNADWGDKKSVLMAGGDLPDAFLGSNAFTASDMSLNKGAFIPLDEYVDKDMPNFKAAMEKDPTMKALATSADGHIYGLPSKRPCRPTVSNQMFINQKWLDNIGMKMPQTYDEFYEVLKAFKEKDANGNGDPNLSLIHI